MSDEKKDDGGNAFPVVETDPMCGTRIHPGMSLRQWYAGMAMQGILAAYYDKVDPIIVEDVAEDSFHFADAMIEAGKQ